MKYFILYIDWIFSVEVFIILLITFLIGYYFGIKKNLPKKDTIKTKQQSTKNINDIETLFTEIKPEIIKIIQEHQQLETKNPKSMPISIDFTSIGYAREIDKDDLTRINGIGPFVEEKLNAIGIYTFDQISRMSDNDIIILTRILDYFPGRIERDNWVEQAKELISKQATL